ncbi:4-alpha-glucanotransferase [Olsenella sp. YH-ols2217]|uniref:4-alpha-glucanotransferase n=1 Tax=Kribbibacterium absianum TaxID=3044210 RepID=A0ABT6ZL74_9ACTN|nr:MULTISPECIES: 4-alpha-glucanotransferase [unclassified Olsenella]MDJ1121786.1 4-alpha-glucanotransferase [Olsenella sp. YH-ols2216]MDJ1129794.1 4-alpha-glucanotransferase [Olsenella sp. YH-ols2217]
MTKRAAGVLLPVTSLPSSYGVGTMGAAAREFVDFLAAADQAYWQMLPVGPTSYGDSPYQSFSSYAGNPYLIDLDDLAAEGLLDAEDYQGIAWGAEPGRVDYGRLYRERTGVLAQAVNRLLLSEQADDFALWCEAEASWLDDYALFMALKDRHEGRPWWEWPCEFQRRDPDALEAASEELACQVGFWKGVQFLFYSQWNDLRDYAHSRGIEIIGDMPIYVARDSADVWAHPQEFQLDETLTPTDVAGCPPDGFSATGQLWGNPLFDWDAMEENGYEWFVGRTAHMFRLFDVLRIDHFRGFDTYYAVPFGDDDACDGEWRQGPGMRLFHAIREQLGDQRIIAEDLGFLTDTVKQLLADSGYPGMKVLEFAFDSRDGGGRGYQPHNIPSHSVAYVGTHDNPTALGWFEEAELEDAAYAKAYLGLNEDEGYHWGMMRGIWASPADLAVVQAQDLLGLGSEGRMNVPSTLGGNWTWRLLPGQLDDELAAKVARCMDLYERAPLAVDEDADGERAVEDDLDAHGKVA